MPLILPPHLLFTMLAPLLPPPWGPLVGSKRRRVNCPSPRSNRSDDLVPPPPTAAEAGSILTRLAGAEAGALPSSPAEVRIVASHPDDKI